MRQPPQNALHPFALQHCHLPQGTVAYRSSGGVAAPTHVLLHGISSSSSNWAYQLQAAARAGLHVLAWDAPGYGQSTALAPAQPTAADYAQRLWDWLDALNASAPVVLVGHSLGALMATSAAALQPARVRGLVLLSPALGYGDAPAEERNKKRDDRLAMLAKLGPSGMAAARSAAMLAPDAPADVVDAVRDNVARINVAGYTQATHMLAGATLLQDLARVTCPVRVASGEADTITPPAQCDRAAAQAHTARVSLGPVGHICTLEAPDPVNALLGFVNAS